MITTIQAFLKKHFDSTDVGGASDGRQALQAATAVLLMEIARADTGVDAVEREMIQRIISAHFELTPGLAREISRLAEQEADEVTSLHPYTRLINTECSIEDKISIVRMLWQVTCADGKIDKHEEHLVRRVAALLHVPHREFIRTKLEVTAG
jgi:uncharacterized tellurite resistance protein B-like protein